MEKASLPVLVLHPADVAYFERAGVDLAAMGYEVRQPERFPMPAPAPRVLTGQPQGPTRQRNGRELRRLNTRQSGATLESNPLGAVGRTKADRSRNGMLPRSRAA